MRKTSSMIALLLYAPFGIILCFLRLCISLQLAFAIYVLPQCRAKRWILRVLFAIMGIVVHETNPEARDDSCRVLVSNHVTPLDHVAVSLVRPCVTTNMSPMPRALSYLLGYRDLGSEQRRREDFFAGALKYMNTTAGQVAILMHPENGTTNGAVALMKYNSVALQLGEPVLAVALKVHRIPIINLAPTIMHASWLSDLIFFLFSPITVFNITYVDRYEANENESVDETALRIQHKTALVLGIKVSLHTIIDKHEYEKRLAATVAAATAARVNVQLQSMATQVKEVLPYLPMDIIKRDLVRTRNVDQTITNFLEGNVPEPIPQPPSIARAPLNVPTPTVSAATFALNVTSSDTIAEVNFNTAASCFGKSSVERITSIEERKAVLIANARRLYLSRHPE